MFCFLADVVRIFFTDVAAGLTIAYSTCRAFDQTDVVHGGLHNE